MSLAHLTSEEDESRGKHKGEPRKRVSNLDVRNATVKKADHRSLHSAAAVFERIAKHRQRGVR